MLKAVKDLGEYLTNSEGLSEEAILTDSSKLSRTKKMICVTFKRENDTLIFNNVHIEDFSQEKSNKILFRPFRHGQYGAFLTSMIAVRKKGKEIDHVASIGNIKKKWVSWFKKYAKKLKNYKLFQSLENELFEDEDIFKKIIDIYRELENEDIKNCLITIKIKDEEREKYPSEIQEFAEIFRENSFEDLFSKHDVIARGNSVCAFCGKLDEVMPGSPFAFFTVKKEGFAYNFDRKNSWKQLPICKHCALDLQAAKEWIVDKDKLNLSFNLYGYKYFIIPYFLFKGVSNEIMNEIKLRKSDDYRDGLLNAEEDILETIKDKEDIFNLIFVFYEQKHQSLTILRHIEEVPPSWIKEIYDTFRDINQKNLFREKKLKIIFGKKWSGNFLNGELNGNTVWKSKNSGKLAVLIKEFYYHREKKGKIFDKSSLNTLGNILEAKQVDKNYFIKHLIRAIREEHGKVKKGKDWNERFISLKSLYLFDFLLNLGLISRNETIKFEGADFMKTNVLNVDKFFNEFSNAFDTSDKKAVFLEGVLVSFLLDVQFTLRNEKPFRKKLRGLKLNEKIVKRLFPETIEKLRQYDAGYYLWLETLISKYLIEADDRGWIISDDEISYYFTLGLSCGKLFKGGEEN